MTWDQIEVKWAEMARRVRADAPFRTASGPDEDPPTIPPGDLPGDLPPPAPTEARKEARADVEA